ncbi:MAG: hypothetical protein A2X59_09500 [Nitrospirae bacterium GWC2_42_7]|nr:MAG: hypothetical protein A2X59_09500 [Nitrospirae bacterium GWC2_42_7]
MYLRETSVSIRIRSENLCLNYLSRNAIYRDRPAAGWGFSSDFPVNLHIFFFLSPAKKRYSTAVNELVQKLLNIKLNGGGLYEKLVCIICKVKT